MKIQKVVLKEIEVVEVNGEFEKRFINEKAYPAFLTNASVKRGFEEGLIQSSLWEDLLAMKGLEQALEKEEGNNAVESLATINDQKFIGVIYLGVLGANKNLTLTFDEFLEKYHEPMEKTIELYVNLLTSLISQDTNQFAQSFNTAAKRNKKKRRPHRKNQSQTSTS